MRYLPLILLLLLFSCGKKDSGKKSGEDVEVLSIDGSNVQGVYEGTLVALNFNTSLGNIGSVGIHRSSDVFQAFVKLYIGEMGVTHRQSVHQGSRCPTVADDANGDGYVDGREAWFVVGNSLLPLDDDLNSQSAGRGLYPRGVGMAGGYFYERTASFARMFEDLRSPDPNTLDDLDKISPNEGVSFHRKVVMIYGIGKSTRLPESVDSIGGGDRHFSLPVACAVLMKSSRFPAELYDRSERITRPSKPPRATVTPRTPEHREPDDEIITPLPDPDPPRRPRLRQRVRSWWRDNFGEGGDGSRLTE